MKPLIIILLACVSVRCLSQADYKQTLEKRVDQIKKLDYYNNKVVVWIDSVEYYDMDFPYWTPNDTYYRDDIARYKYCQYLVSTDSTKGHRPDTSRTQWTLIRGPHPYLFLRDTAKLDDLKKLMSDKHPYIRSYAFGALSYRKSDNLFPFIIENLKDTSQMLEYTGDVGLNAYPADLMIEYEVYRLTDTQKKKLNHLITSKYPHLDRALRVSSRL